MTGTAALSSVELARGVIGLCQLFAPKPLFRAVVGSAPPPAAVATTRILGARNVIQAVLLVRAGKTAHRCGAIVDVAHAASMAALAGASARWQRPCATDAVLASAWAALEAA